MKTNRDGQGAAPTPPQTEKEVYGLIVSRKEHGLENSSRNPGDVRRSAHIAGAESRSAKSQSTQCTSQFFSRVNVERLLFLFF